MSNSSVTMRRPTPKIKTDPFWEPGMVCKSNLMRSPYFLAHLIALRKYLRSSMNHEHFEPLDRSRDRAEIALTSTQCLPRTAHRSASRLPRMGMECEPNKGPRQRFRRNLVRSMRMKSRGWFYKLVVCARSEVKRTMKVL